MGRAAETRDRNVDLPALGMPISPTSAISFSLRMMIFSSPGWPGLAWRGAWLVELLKCALPKPPLPPRSKLDALAGRRQIGDQRLAVFFVDLRTDRHFHDRVVAVGAGHLLAHAAFAVLGADMLLEAVIDQRVEIVDRLDPDVAALAAIAAPGAAIFDELLAPERDAAVPAVAGLDIDLGDVEEFHGADRRESWVRFMRPSFA